MEIAMDWYDWFIYYTNVTVSSNERSTSMSHVIYFLHLEANKRYVALDYNVVADNDIDTDGYVVTVVDFPVRNEKVDYFRSYIATDSVL